jgi:AraC family transcriptional regulator
MPNPRYVELSPLLVAGMREPLHEQNAQTIPIWWQKFAPFIGKIPHQIGQVAYGLCVQSSESSNGSFYYMAGCEVSEFADLLSELSPLIVPAHKYAVFNHGGHVSKITDTIDYVFDKWLPESGQKHNAQSIHFFERYGENFNPQSGLGGMEIWLPIF